MHFKGALFEENHNKRPGSYVAKYKTNGPKVLMHNGPLSLNYRKMISNHKIIRRRGGGVIPGILRQPGCHSGAAIWGG